MDLPWANVVQIFIAVWEIHAIKMPWWRHQMETFSVLLVICARNSPVTVEFPAQRPVTRSFDVFFDLRLNKRLSKQSWSWWFETPSRPLWRHCNDHVTHVRDARDVITACSVSPIWVAIWQGNNFSRSALFHNHSIYHMGPENHILWSFLFKPPFNIIIFPDPKM